MNKMEADTYGELFRELVSSISDLIRSELNLLNEEAKDLSGKVGAHSIRAGLFGAICVASIFPFLAFLVIGLGDLLEGRYWLSSLIVAVVCALGGGLLARQMFHRLKSELSLPRSANFLQREKDRLQRKINDVKEAVQRRAV